MEYIEGIIDILSLTKGIMSISSFILVLIIIGVSFIFTTCILIFQYICFWKIFEKMGEEGWKAIVPVYNLIILYQKIGLSPYLLFIYLAAFIPSIGSLATIAMGIIQSIYLGKAFKKETGFIVGIAIVPLVFEAILAFDKNSKYELT